MWCVSLPVRPRRRVRARLCYGFDSRPWFTIGVKCAIGGDRCLTHWGNRRAGRGDGRAGGRRRMLCAALQVVQFLLSSLSVETRRCDLRSRSSPVSDRKGRAERKTTRGGKIIQGWNSPCDDRRSWARTWSQNTPSWARGGCGRDEMFAHGVSLPKRDPLRWSRSWPRSLFD